jgi:cytochrome c556
VKSFRALLVVAVAGAVLVSAGLPARSQDKKDTTELMKKKLAHSQKILEGLALNDFDAMARSAGELIEISKLAQWKIVNSPQYELHSNEFRRNAESVIKAAKDKNLDGAAIAYVELTLGCVKCHKYVREVRMTRLDD